MAILFNLGSVFLTFLTAHNALAFYNPIVAKGQDPSVKFYNGNYYFTQSVNDASIAVMRSPKLELIGSPEETVTVFTGSGELCCEVWAPELYYSDDTGLWYIYFAADQGNNADHHSYVIQSFGADPLGPYTFIGKMAATTDLWAIDSTVMKLNEQLYYVWAGAPSYGSMQENIYIATMSSPINITSDRFVISEPTNPWEQAAGGFGINEGPAVLQANGYTWIVYSASGAGEDTYCLATLSYVGGDPLQQSSWLKSDGCVFATDVSNSAYGPGHNCFTTSPDLTQIWNVYHAQAESNAGFGGRSIRTQVLNFNSDGTPNFGTPVGFDDWVDPPSGE